LRLAGRNRSFPPLVDSASYLRRAAINAALDVVRGRASSHVEPPDEMRAAPSGAERRELRECLRKALAQLRPNEAEVFALRYFEDQSNAEVARTLGKSQVWVAVTLHRARRRLQKEISSYLGNRR